MAQLATQTKPKPNKIMKLVVQMSEVKVALAEKHNIPTHDIEIAPEPISSFSPFQPHPGVNATPEQRLRYLGESVREAKAHNKIGAIKAFRSATGCGLKEAKDFVEAHFCPPPF